MFGCFLSDLRAVYSEPKRLVLVHVKFVLRQGLKCAVQVVLELEL